MKARIGVLVCSLSLLVTTHCHQHTPIHLSITTALPNSHNVQLTCDTHTWHLDSLSPQQPATLKTSLKRPPKRFKLTWTTSNGQRHTCTFPIRGNTPTLFQFHRDTILIDLQKHGACLTFLVNQQPMGRVACS